MNTCFDVANYFLKSQDLEAGDTMSNMKLQKLVYYAQGFCLAMTGKPLFLEPIEAWDHGPVCVPLYHKYKEYSGDALPIPFDADAYSVFTKEVYDILDMVHTYYAQFAAWKLRNLTHEEIPWIKAFRRKNPEISHESMKDYFKTQLTDEDED